MNEPPIKHKKNNAPDIMVVDDTPANLTLLGNILEKKGYKVRLLTSGKLAMRAAQMEPPDLVLLDIMMPGMDGYQVCRLLKADQRLQEIPVIFISARIETIDKVKAFSVGGVDYITKPFQLQEVLARVDTHLRFAEFNRALQAKNAELESALKELKAMQAQLVQSEKMASLGVLSAGIAHEINNPINFISSGVVALKKTWEKMLPLLDCCDHHCKEKATATDPNPDHCARNAKTAHNVDIETLKADTRILLDNISVGATRTAAIVKGLQTFSRQDEDEKKSCHLDENIDSTLLLLRHRFNDSISVIKDYTELPPIVCFPARLNQLFMNILSNAIDALRDSDAIKNGTAQIRISIKSEKKDHNEYVIIQIQDNGPGVPPEIKDRIFEPFFTTREVGKGMGLGLAVCLGIVGSHNGHITADNIPGGGFCVTIRLPQETAAPY